MKHYKIVNLNEEIIQEGGGELTILSYNVSWEAMTSNTTGNFKLCTDNDSNNGICKSNILANISSNIKKYTPEFATFQEAAEYQDIVELFDSNIYSPHINTSGKEIMLSIWNKKKFTLVKTFDYEFEEGRPFSIIILMNNKSKKNIALINLHAGHYSDTQKSIFDKINSFIKSNISRGLKKSINRLIMSGDFNRDVYEDTTSNYIVKFSDEFELKRFANKKQTCCSLIGYGHSHVYDHIIDSKSVISKKILGNSVKNYKIPSSDHILVIGKLKN
jgi:hypothetical protein